jgi:hypothetical protein
LPPSRENQNESDGALKLPAANNVCIAPMGRFVIGHTVTVILFPA